MTSLLIECSESFGISEVNHSCILRINSSWSQCNIFRIHFQIKLLIFHSEFVINNHKGDWSVGLFFCPPPHHFNINIRTRRRKGKAFHPSSQEIVDNYEISFPSYSFIQLFYIFHILLKNHLNYCFHIYQSKIRGRNPKNFCIHDRIFIKYSKFWSNSFSTLIFFKVLIFFIYFCLKCTCFASPGHDADWPTL